MPSAWRHWLGQTTLAGHFRQDRLWQPHCAKGGAGSTCSALLGAMLGAWAGYKGGWWDEVIMRFIDGLMASRHSPSHHAGHRHEAGTANTIIAIGIANVPVSC